MKLKDNECQVMDLLHDAVKALCQKFLRIEGHEYDKFHPYFKRNLLKKRSVIFDDLMKYSRILFASIINVDKPLSDMVIVDYGAGYGLLGALAKELGVGTVLYNDISSAYLADAKRLMSLLNISINGYIIGDIEVLYEYSKDKRLHVDCIASYDVLEHIYNLDSFYEKVSHFPSPLCCCMASGANIKNFRIRRYLVRQQRISENVGRKLNFDDNPHDLEVSYLSARAEIIKSDFSNLDKAQIDYLARLTRGMRADDINAAVKLYLSTGSAPAPLSHSTNTCNPYTGSWDEHLIEHRSLLCIAEKYSFEGSLVPGRYDRSCWGKYKRIVYGFLNFIINDVPSVGIYLAPHYIFTVKK